MESLGNIIGVVAILYGIYMLFTDDGLSKQEKRRLNDFYNKED